jgi:hypothetical protein
MRAKMVLMAAEGMANVEIAARLDTSPQGDIAHENLPESLTEICQVGSPVRGCLVVTVCGYSSLCCG